MNQVVGMPSIELQLAEAYAKGREDERKEREAWEANVRGLQSVQMMQAWSTQAMQSDTEDSVQASAIAEHHSMEIQR